MRGLLAQTALLVAVFAAATGIAEAAGAANLGTSLGFGQIAFAIVLVALLVKRYPGFAASTTRLPGRLSSSSRSGTRPSRNSHRHTSVNPTRPSSAASISKSYM